MPHDPNYNFAVVRDADNEIVHEHFARVSKTDTLLVSGLSLNQAVQTKYALRRGVDKIEPNLVTSGSGPRFIRADLFFAWRPVRLVNKEWAWFRKVMRLRFGGHLGDYVPNFGYSRYAPKGDAITG